MLSGRMLRGCWEAGKPRRWGGEPPPLAAPLARERQRWSRLGLRFRPLWGETADGPAQSPAPTAADALALALPKRRFPGLLPLRREPLRREPLQREALRRETLRREPLQRETLQREPPPPLRLSSPRLSPAHLLLQPRCPEWPLQRFSLRRLTTIGHRVELGSGRRKNVVQRERWRGPLVPRHPAVKQPKNLDYFVVYKDLRIKWRKHMRASRVPRLHIKRKRRLRNTYLPDPRPTCAWIAHGAPHTAPAPELPAAAGALDLRDVFAVFKSSFRAQHKVTRGDLVLVDRIRRREAGEKIAFGTVLLVGTRDWTIIGKPTVPYAKVLATVEQQTVTKERNTYHKNPGRSASKFFRSRYYVTILHIDDIVVDPAMRPQLDPPKPLRFIDLFANRRLDPDEMQGIKFGPDGATPVVEAIYDGTEPRPGFMQSNLLTDCFRCYPDPFDQSHSRFLPRKPAKSAPTVAQATAAAGRLAGSGCSEIAGELHRQLE